MESNMVFMDLTEPTVLGCGGYRYISTIVHSQSGYVDVCNCKRRSEALLHLCTHLDQNPYVTGVRVDGAAELNGSDA